MTDGSARGRLLFASLPSAGLINPLLAVAQELVRRDAQLWFACTDERADEIRRIGADDGEGPVRFVSLGRYRPHLWPANWGQRTLRAMTTGRPVRDFAAFMDTNVDHEYTDELYRRMLATIDEVRPDLIVTDSCTGWAIDAAMKRGIPYVLTIAVPVSSFFVDTLPWSYPTPGSGLPARMSPRQRIGNVLYRLGTRAVMLSPRRLRPALAALQRRKAEGLPNAAGIPSHYARAAAAVLGCSVFGLEYPFPDVPPNLRMVGAVLPADSGPVTPDPDLDAWIDAHKSIVYIGFGTFMRPSAGQVQALVEVARRLGPRHHVLWKLPEAQQRLLPAKLPANLRVEAWLPSQLAVLAHPHVRLFFNHGGGNAFHEGLVHGKPLLVMPFWMDCNDFAARAADSGAGLVVPNVDTPDIDEIVLKITKILNDPAFRTAAEHWARELRSAGGSTAAADVILDSLDRPGPVTDSAPADQTTSR
ncbi:glycosyltransferase [Micromonospora eburnea]|uniref:Polyene glycosyltransferase n=1 Tax=Micromonospora eburnea TaxID=227316 RepID=A0A1C6UZA3_9ACTN|nr:glycosyltransferase [Micromonospora eburnea]SCL59383.1 polyene glycosyltransferase [Micromonospora eburnea]